MNPKQPRPWPSAPEEKVPAPAGTKREDHVAEDTLHQEQETVHPPDRAAEMPAIELLW